MGFSSKQVPSNRFDWTHNLLQSSGLEFSKSNPSLIQQQQQQFAQPLNCPRCDSTNTKFCYYNNYNRTQPRHYCKSCKRHWTKGGTLRNVPVGGVRQNKRQKTNKAKNNSNRKKTVTNHNLVAQVQQQPKQEHIQVSTSCDYQKQDTNSEFLYESLIDPASTTARRQNVFSVETSNIGDGNSFMGSSSIDPVPMFQFTSLSSVNHNHQQPNPSLHSSPTPTFSNGGFQSYSNNCFNYSGDSASIESASPWQEPNTSNFINSSPINWSWEDLNTFISTDLKHP